MSRRVFISFWLLLGTSLLAILDLHGQSRRPNAPLFRVGVESVFVRVSVIDPLNRFVTGLEKEHFQVFEDKVQQSISYFNKELTPISVGIIFDVSSSILGDIPMGSSKNFIIMASPPPDTEGDFPFTVRVSNTCGQPSSIDVTGTVTVTCPCGDMTVSPTSWNILAFSDRFPI